MTLERFVNQHIQLLEKEREAEIEETRHLNESLPPKELQRRGVCLLKLHIRTRRTGFYGRTVVVFEPGGGNQELPAHNLSPGDIVGLNASSAPPGEEGLGSGIVTHTGKSAISVAFDEKEDLFSLSEDDQYKLTKLANDVTYKRLKNALNNLKKGDFGVSSKVVNVLFGETDLSPPFIPKDVHLVNNQLDKSQQDAVQFALAQPEVAIVHGPPGTGKTTTVIEIIIQAVKQGNKILACAPSNIAVDNLVERLASHKQKVVRLGHPARVLPNIQKYSLDAILSSSEETRLVEDVRKDLDKNLSTIRKTTDRGEKQKIKEDIKFLRKELMQREEAASREILKRADVVLATLSSADVKGPIKYLDKEHFDLVVIDECSQAVEAACWIPLLRAPRCVLAGDHLQLPPTILSKEAASAGLEKTLMERVLDLYGDKVMRMLTTQYRMHQLIMQWSSDQLYDGKLTAHSSVACHLLRDIESVEESEETAEPLLLIDTAGCQLYELDVPEEISKGNEGEADIVSNHVEKLINLGVDQQEIAVIAPYNLQVELLRLRLSNNYPKVEIKSVDGFQGREKEAVIISLVRSNAKGEVGFLAEKRRINVAVTRARRHLAVVCDSETVGHNSFLKSLVDYMSSHGVVKTAQEFVEAGVVYNTLTRPDHLNDLLTLPNNSKGTKPKSAKNQQKSQIKKKPGKTENQALVTEKYQKTQEETDERIKEFQGYLDQFVQEVSSDELEFPSTLNSHDRMLVHELSEKMGLGHISKGSGKDRHLVVSKPGSKNSGSTQYTAPSNSETFVNRRSESRENEKPCIDGDKRIEASEEEADVLNQEEPDKVVCRHCSKSVIKANIQLHETHCLRTQRQKSAPKSATSGGRKQKDNAPRAPNAHADVVAKLEKVDGDDLDSLIAAVQSVDKECSFKKCKTSTLTLGQLCDFCRRRFCLNHHMPEIHGCGEAAKTHARATIIREGVLYRGSGVPDKKPDAARKAQLQKKMDKKLTEMATKRQGKKPKK
ncbi:DNA-binding protein SMUBP-2-like [Saccostrea echinata]|uniref:DNA-binding protein SMUBP-2-like n=1 Tax=Saccostrea echinata TaxID=191078 RepID=UPI002A807DBA|nr:DNA-binding protein SMUBP-2-like [Saccostrea echinata]